MAASLEDIIINVYTAGTANTWYEERADFVVQHAEAVDGCADIVVPLDGVQQVNAMQRVSADIQDKTKDVSIVALTINTAATGEVSFRLASMQLNEYNITYE